MIGRKVGVVTKFKAKVQEYNGGGCYWAFQCILHLDALCCKSLKMDHVFEVVVRTVNFISARGLNHRQFETFFRDRNITHSLPYQCEVRWLSRGPVSMHFFNLQEDIIHFVEKKRKKNGSGFKIPGIGSESCIFG
ncbi:unnamed protein product [Lepeophtheirus salmonis]|uniref:(salmon louse) hypothetical protein n=1 Tax=Lepeophtheirus salmonis TaxID=72036 RepID=A0A7R8D414_LEPSM|nr:unnamed protein product [Lepeophtheirus salmonis]CAF2970037.1 unnamed protein product [Lepeophtheirus salmonis]